MSKSYPIPTQAYTSLYDLSLCLRNLMRSRQGGARGLNLDYLRSADSLSNLTRIEQSSLQWVRRYLSDRGDSNDSVFTFHQACYQIEDRHTLPENEMNTLWRLKELGQTLEHQILLFEQGKTTGKQRSAMVENLNLFDQLLQPLLVKVKSDKSLDTQSRSEKSIGTKGAGWFSRILGRKR